MRVAERPSGVIEAPAVASSLGMGFQAAPRLRLSRASFPRPFGFDLGPRWSVAAGAPVCWVYGIVPEHDVVRRRPAAIGTTIVDSGVTLARLRRAPIARCLTWRGAFDDPRSGAVPRMIFVTSRAAHTHFDFRKCMKYHRVGVEARGNWLPRGRTENEDVAFDSVFG